MAIIDKQTSRTFHEETVRQAAKLYRELVVLDEDELDTMLRPRNYPGLLGLAEAVGSGSATKAEIAVHDFDEGTFGSARFDYWARMPIWNRDEAAALSLGAEPGYVIWFSSRVGEYLMRYDQMNRARQIGELDEPATPFAILEWAERWDIRLPEDLAHEIRRLREHQQSLAKPGTEAHASPSGPNHPTSALAETPSPYEAKPPGARERETLLKLIISMAINGYRYNPNGKRNDAV